MKKSAFLIALSFLCAVFVSSAVDAIGSGQNEKPAWKTIQKDDEEIYDLSTILVKFENRVTKKQRDDLANLVGGKFKDKNGDGVDDRYEHILNGRLALMELKGEKGLDLASRALRALRNHPFIEYVEYNYLHYIDLTPNDPRFSELWGLYNTGQTGGTPDADIDAPEAWEISAGSSEVTVGVIDTGIDYNHEDLAANMWINTDEIGGNGIDDDGNGYVDDVHGINAITGSGDPMDDHYHGTHCAGTIGAVGNNGKGVAGVNWTVKLIGMKFLNSGGSGTTADAIKCIDYAVDLKKYRGVNIRVLSNSWGGGGYEQSLEDAISDANNEGILFVASAGNSSANNDVSPHYPSSYDNPNVLAIASTEHNDNLSYFSNYGLISVDLGAPGSSILSTFPNNSYASISGTSMATPHVSGAAALLLSVNDQLTVQEMKTLLMNYGDPLDALSGKCFSGNRLNIYNALLQVSPPGPTFRLSADPAAQSIEQGQTASYTINIESVSGYSNSVNLSASSDPAINATVTFNPGIGNPGSSSILGIVTTTDTVPGGYLITVTGESGSIAKTTTVTLKVNPEGLTTVAYTNDEDIDIPDYQTPRKPNKPTSPTGITSTIDIPDSLNVWETACEVHINHTYIRDLIVKLISPSGTEAILHNREGGSADNIHKTYYPTEFRNENCQGTWQLFVSDNAQVDVGTLDSWTLIIGGIPTSPVDPPPTKNNPPDAAFSVIIAGLKITCTDLSTDSDGTIVSWFWDFGDGKTSTAQNPRHRYPSSDTYAVTLTVTDDGGAIGSKSSDPFFVTK